MTDEPPAPDDPEHENQLHRLFRGLRERVFVGSSELVSRVMHGVEEQLQTNPKESLAVSLLVQVLNFVTSRNDGDEADPARKDDRGPDAGGPTRGPEPGGAPSSRGDDDE